MRRRSTAAVVAAVAALLSMALLAGPAIADNEYVLVKKWGSKGSAIGQFDIPIDIDMASNGDLFVADADNDRVQAFDPNGAFRFAWSTSPTDPNADYGTFPRELALDPAGFVYVVDANSVAASHYEWTVNKYTTSGNFVQNVQVPDAGSFNVPDIATDSAGNLYMATYGDSGPRVLKVSPSGALLAQWSTPITGEIRNPNAIDVDAAGFVYVGVVGKIQSRFGTAAGMVHKFTGTGALVHSWGGFPAGPNAPGFYGIDDIEVGSDGSIFVLEEAGQRVQQFDSSARFLGRFEPRGDLSGIAVGGDGLLYATSFAEVEAYRPQPAAPKLKKKGKGRTRKRKISIKFSGAGAASFECRLTGNGVQKKLKRWRRCRSPKRYAGLGLGQKVFRVRGVDAAGTRGKPATKKWVIIP